MKTTLLSFLLLSSSLVFAQKRLSFEKMAPMLNEAYAFGYSQSNQDIFVLTGGDDFLRYNYFLQVYDTRLDYWMGFEIKELPIMNYPSTVFMENYNGLLLLGGTQPYGSSVALVEEIRMLKLDDLSVVELGELPEPARNMGLAQNGNTVYFFGGSTRATPQMLFSSKFFSYDLERGHLEMLPDLPVAMETKGGIINDQLYVFGGWNEKTLDEIWKFNLTEKKWTSLGPLDKSISSYALTQYQHYFILVGSHNDNKQLIVYDTKKEKAEYFKLNFETKSMGASVVGDYLYIYGGRVPPPNPYIRNDLYRIAISEIIHSMEQ